MAARPVSSQPRRKSQPTFLCLCVRYILAFCKRFTLFSCLKYILHSRNLSTSLYMYDFQFAPIPLVPFWGVHVCQLMRFLLSRDFTLKDIRIRKNIYWCFESVSRNIPVLNAFCIRVFRSFLIHVSFFQFAPFPF